MAKGENIFKRKDGRWEGRYIKGYEPSSKIRYGFCYAKSYKTVKEKVTAAKTAILNGKPLHRVNTKHRFAFYCNEWLGINKINLKESTYVKYKATVEKHIVPKLGECYPSAITDSEIKAFTDELLFEEKLAPKTVRDILSVLRSILKYTSKLCPWTFPEAEIRYPKEEKKEVRVLTKDEQIRFIHYLLANMNNCKFGILLTLLTGIRIGELCALKWENISLKDNTVRISATMQRLKDMNANRKSKTKVVMGSPKTYASNRIIPLIDTAAALCGKMRSKNPSAFILTGTSDYMEPRLLQYHMNRYTEACGLDNVHLHTLRHTFATRCVEAGFEIKSLSEILGHANTSVTLDRYIHSSMEMKRSNMKRLTMAGF